MQEMQVGTELGKWFYLSFIKTHTEMFIHFLVMLGNVFTR